MMLRARIKAKYLDRILKGEKKSEYRQIEGIELTDENGRVAVFGVRTISSYGRNKSEEIKAKFPDVPWSEGRVYRIHLKEMEAGK